MRMLQKYARVSYVFVIQRVLRASCLKISVYL